nr:uncharacterized protein LOC111510089 [Leptinotarsa decemlineata]
MERSMEDEFDSKHDLNTVLGTIFLFLKNQNFFKTSEAFKNDCEKFGIRLPNISGKVFFRTDEHAGTIDDCKRSKQFIDKRIILETFLEKHEETQPSKEKQRHAGNSAELQQQSLRQKFSQLQEEYKNLLAVTSELTNALQMNILSQAKSVNIVLDQCKTIYPSLFQTPRNEEESKEMKVSVVEGSSVPISSCLENSEVELDKRLPSVELLNSDLSTDDNEQTSSHRTQAQVSASPSQGEIKDILETILNRALYFLNDKQNAVDCCAYDKAYLESADEISKMLENILLKVMASPRCKSGSSSCCKDNSVFETSKTPMTARNDASFKFQPEMDTHSISQNIQREEEPHPEKEINVTGDILCQTPVAWFKGDRKIICGTNRPRSVEECVRGIKVENLRCSSCFSLNSLKERENFPITKKTVIEESPKKYDEQLQSSPQVQTNDETKNSNHEKAGKIPLHVVEERKSVKPIQQFVKFQTPLCYLEICRRLQDGNKNCRCRYCVPGKSRYYCGCYDVIRKDIEEETDGIDDETTYRKINFFKNLYNNHEIGGPKVLDHYMCERRCSVCKDVICKCAFESRPKIRRTPPE